MRRETFSGFPSVCPSRCQSTSPCPVLFGRQPQQQQSQQPVVCDGEGKQSRYVRTNGRFLGLTKSKSISCLDNRLSIYKPPGRSKPRPESPGSQQEQQRNQGDHSPGDGLNGRPLSWSTLSLGPSSAQSHRRTLSLSHSVAGVPANAIRKKISEWECRRVSLPRMSLCLDKRVGERVGGSEGCPSLLSSPCGDKTFDFKSARRMSAAFSECSFTGEDEATSERDAVIGRFQKRSGGKSSESSGMFARSVSARKETSAVLNRIQKIEQALKDHPSPQPPRLLNNCYAPDRARQKPFMLSDDLDSTCASKRSSVCSVATEPDSTLVSEKLSKLRQRFSISSARSESPEPPAQQGASVGSPVNPLPKPKRTFEYDAKGEQKGPAPANGLPPKTTSESPPPLPSTPAPGTSRTPKTDGGEVPDR